MSARVSPVAKVAATVGVLVAGLWMGGMIALGAVAAPIVFQAPAPWSADTMTTVFRRFDKVAMVCAAILVLVELARAAMRETIAKLDGARIVAVVLAAGLAVWGGMSLSPRIEALHRGGAIRGLGELGEELEAVHKLAERVAQIELALLAVVITLHVLSVARGARPAAKRSAARDPADADQAGEPDANEHR